MAVATGTRAPCLARPDPIMQTFGNDRQLDALAIEQESFAVCAAYQHEVAAVEE